METGKAVVKIIAQHKSLEELMKLFGITTELNTIGSKWLATVERDKFCFWKQDTTAYINGLVIFSCMASDKLTLHNPHGPAQIFARLRDELWTIHKTDLLYRILGDRWTEEDFYARPEMLKVKLNNIICLQ